MESQLDRFHHPRFLPSTTRTLTPEFPFIDAPPGTGLSGSDRNFWLCAKIRLSDSNALFWDNRGPSSQAGNGTCHLMHALWNVLAGEQP